MKKLQLYVWRKVLADWTSGVAFALAESPEQAADLLKAKLPEAHWDGIKLDGQSPQEYDQPTCGYVYGGA